MIMNPHKGGQPRFHTGDTWLSQAITSLDQVATVVADVAIRPTLMQHGDTQVLAFYDNARRLSIANRIIPDGNWRFQKTNSKVGWDSHNYVDLGFDPSGRLHVAGNMHASPLQYWIGELDGSSTGLRRVEVLSSADREQRVTYPRFLRANDGQLLFSYRDGTSGDGDFICLRWDDEASRYQALTDRPLIQGEGKRNAYIDTNAPIQGPDGEWHMLWVWRDSPHAESTHTVNYARSPDLMSWRNAAGGAIDYPITYECNTVVDPVPPGNGLINNNVRLGFFPSGRPFCIYHKRDRSGYQQIWAAAFDDTQWGTRQLTQWEFRWDFSGKGSLDFRIEIGLPVTTTSGFLVDVRRDQYVETLAVSEDLCMTSMAPAAPWSPLCRVKDVGALYERVTQGRAWSPADGGADSFVCHSSVPEQRDQEPVGEAPLPQPIFVVKTSQVDQK